MKSWDDMQMKYEKYDYELVKQQALQFQAIILVLGVLSILSILSVTGVDKTVEPAGSGWTQN